MKILLLATSLILALSGCAHQQQNTVTHYRWVGDQSVASTQARLEGDFAQCRYDVRKLAMSRPQPAFSPVRGYNDPNMGAAANNMAAAFAGQISPSVIEECMSARGWRAEYVTQE